MAKPDNRTEYQAYALGKLDFMNAIAGGLPLQCGLNMDERKDTALLRKWVQGCNHQELHIKARLPVVKVETRQFLRP